MKIKEPEKRVTMVRAVVTVVLALAVVLAGYTGVTDIAEERAKDAAKGAGQTTQ